MKIHHAQVRLERWPEISCSEGRGREEHRAGGAGQLAAPRACRPGGPHTWTHLCPSPFIPAPLRMRCRSPSFRTCRPWEGEARAAGGAPP